MKITRRLIVSCLLLFAVFGSAWAQGNDGQYVIKKAIYKKVVDNPGPPETYHYVVDETDQHYLAHVRVGDNYELQDADEFSPNCLWYSGRETSLSGTNHNYYFVDHNGEYRFLSAPLESNGTLSLSASQPPVYLLNNTDQSYYFYDWDYDNYPEGAGVARGHQHNGVTQTTCDFNWEDGQCWEVYWVESKEPTPDNFIWQLSHDYQYDITDNSGRFRLVTDTPTAMQVTTTGGGLAELGDVVLETVGSSSSPSATFSVLPFDYTPAYHKYDFNDVKRPNDNNSNPASTLELVHHTYYYCYGSTTTTEPTSAQAVSSGSNSAQWNYNWSISGEGAQYLTLTGGNTATPTLTYSTENTTGHKTATLTLTVIYDEYGSSQTTSCTVTVKTPCQNPAFSANVTYENVVISWTPTAESYTVSWKKESDSEWTSESVGDVTSHTLTGLEYNTTYDYKVKASCDSDPSSSQFKTLGKPKAVVGGAVFGGGRMANVGGKTEVVIINTDSIGAVYGGNDIAGSVLDTVSSNPQDKATATIILGVNAGTSYSTTYNGGNASTNVRVGDVYGGGNGYYAYSDHGRAFVQASNDFDTIIVFPTDSVSYMTRFNTVGTSAYTNDGSENDTLAIPRIINTIITVNTNVVKVDSIFGGAKNAFITNTADDDGTSITINGGTIFAVFGGNNYGGNQTAGKQYIEINGTKTGATSSGLGRSFGIGYVFGGGNRVEALKTDVVINGGQCDTVFAGGNAADVANVAEAANVTVNCVGSSKTITSAPITWDGNNISAVGSYDWDGTGIYNVRALFGGNNRADMRGLPTITLTAGGVGTVYGGGNSGKMLAQTPEAADNPIATDFGSNYIGSNPLPIYYSTHVKLESSANILVDYLYGGCQMSDVAYSTWVEIEGGHVGSVYGGCNIGGDVGSTRVYSGSNLTNEQKQATQGATYVKASGGTIYGNLFAGANGFYHCNDGVYYIEGHNFTPGHSYIGLKIPSHNETHVKVSGDVIVNGNVYAGGNMACVGFINATTDNRNFPTFRGLCSVRMDGGTVKGSVYGGGCRASVFGSNEVKVSGGSIGYDGETPTGGAIYGGNDRSGQVAQITNRVFPNGNNYDVASDAQTSLTLLGVKTYVGITGKPKVGTVYGGGNGDYQPYDPNEYCDITDQPVQSNTFVDINIDAEGGSETGGYINTVYGGGNGVTVLDRITVFVNVKNAGENVYDHVGTIYGANNIGDIEDLVPDIVLLNGRVNTIYGGGNHGALNFHKNLTFGGETYNDVGSYVYVGKQYRPNGTGTAVNTNVKVSGNIFGGCNQNGVGYNTLVLVEDGEHSATLFGGSNTSGTIGRNSQVVVLDGSVGSVYGGGQGEDTGVSGDVTVVIGSDSGDPTVNGDVYGGSALGSVNTNTSNLTKVWLKTGTVTGSVYGGGLGDLDAGIAAVVKGNVQVINDAADATAIYGCNNENGTPEGTVTVTVNGGNIGSVFGGGNEAAYIPNDTDTNYPLVNISGGNVVHKVVGGGNAANIGSTTVSANPVINISGGNICTESTGIDAGIYGGCNTSGTVYGNVTVNITGSETSQTTIGTIAALEHAYDPTHTHTPVSVHGGGYGEGTEVKGNVTVNFGEDDGSENSQCVYPILYGDLYGGSALGTVNDGSEDQTTVNVLNGIIDGGNVFGGGLGDDTHAVKVWGVVHVNIGAPPAGSSTNYRGQASFHSRRINNVTIGGDVFGGNNKNGSPQQDVYVDVYKTAHTEKDTYTYLESDRTYAIADVYGGGKKAVYAPDENTEKKLHTFIHNCDNTIGYVYGGCDAADAQGTVVTVDGGRFNFIFGGGNGQTQPANITGNVDLSIYGGRVGWYFVGCNLHGEVLGEGIVHIGCPTGYEPHCEELVVENYYFGANEALTVGGLEHVIECENSGDMVFKKVFAGSRLAVVYGDIKLTVRGGEIQNLFGGSEGSATVAADVRKFPDNEAGIDDLPADHQAMVRNYLATHPHDYGKGGNITLILEGGTIHNVFGGNDLNGNIQGVVNIIVNDRNLPCPLNIDYIYGGNNQALYEPNDIVVGGVTQKPITPIVEVVNGTVNYDVFGGSLGGDANIVNAGKITCNPKVVIGDGTPNSTEAHVGHIEHSGEGDVYYGEVFGGGSLGEVVGTTKVILQGNATVDNNVFGGAKNAQVTGNTNVVLGPKMHTLTITQPSSGGAIAVYNSIGVQVNSGDDVPEDAYLRIVATPTAATSAGGYLFNQWEIAAGTGAGSIIDHPSWANSTFTMGTADAELTASFTSVPAKQLTMELGTAGAGSLMVDGNAYTSPVWVAENSSIRVQAIPSPTTVDGGYVFNHWEIAEGTGTGGSISHSLSAITDFNMGTADATLRAYFDHLAAHTLTIVSSGLPDGVSATFTVNGTTYSAPVYVAESVAVTVMVTPPEGYVFSGWTITGTGANIDNSVSSITHCTMGTGDAILTATFTPSRRTDNNVDE